MLQAVCSIRRPYFGPRNPQRTKSLTSPPLFQPTIALLSKTPPDHRVLISVSGIPGSGKTTLATKVVNRLNACHRRNDTDIAAMIPMVTSDISPLERTPADMLQDGYHLTRAVLSAMPNPLEAHARRGAPFTFDSAALKKLILKLREPTSAGAPVIYAPSFDHAKKDPVEDDIAILSTQRVLVFEGPCRLV